MHRTLRLHRPWLRIGWAVLLCHGAFLGFFVLQSWLAIRDGAGSAPLTMRGVNAFGAIAAVVSAVSLFGLLNCWGAPVLCTVAGLCFGLFWAPSPYNYIHDAMEAQMEALGLPVMYALVGAAAGLTFESFKRRNQA